MPQRFLLCLVAFFAANLVALAANAAEPDTRVYELRIYTAAEGKWDKLLNRFKEHTLRLFEKHGMTNVGYWQPLESAEPKLYYLLSFKDATAREQAWKDFLADEDWKAAYKASESDGKLASKMESIVLTATDFSPALDIADKSPRVFELRTYTATPGNLPNLLARFRDHTVKLFEKHGMTNIGYWVPMSMQPEKETTLIYLLAHKERDAAKASFAAFGKDPEWQEARKASEVKGGGPLTIKGGVQSLFLKPVEFSKLK
jgi:hypothetical protein